MPKQVHAQPLAIEAPKRLMLESPGVVAARSALVPLTYERQAWNTIQQGRPGHEYLPHHDSQLTAEQAKAINDYYDIELVFGTHGFGILNKPPGLLHKDSLATQREYRAVWQVIEDLQEGDTLFVEGRGFKQHPKGPFITDAMLANLQHTLAEVERSNPEDIFVMLTLPFFRTYGRLVLQAAATVKIMSSIRDLAQAEQVREQYLASAWTYTRLLASAKGVQVRFADYDRFDDIKTEEHIGKNSTEEMLGTTDIDGQLQFLRTARLREKKARNAAKDWMLANLPPAGTPPPDGRKPKIKILFGSGHKDTMVQAFKDLGLDVKVRQLEESTDEERQREHIIRDIIPLLNQIAFLTMAEMFKTMEGPNTNSQAPAEIVYH